jgi:acetyl esterase/lipase
LLSALKQCWCARPVYPAAIRQYIGCIALGNVPEVHAMSTLKTRRAGPLSAGPASASPASPAGSVSIVPWVSQTIPLAGDRLLRARIYGRRIDGGPTPLVLHFHGGAFTGGSLESGAPVAQLLAQAGSVVLSVDYPLAPADPFPAAVEAGHAAALWLHRNRRRLGAGDAPVLIAGEEAGGNLAAAVALMARDRHRPPLAGQILLSPMLDPCLGTASLREADLDLRECPWTAGWASYLSRVADACHPYAVPGICLRLAQLAPTLLITARDDPMRDETLAFAARLREAGVSTDQAVIQSTTGWPQSLVLTDERPVAAQEASARIAGPDWKHELHEHLRRFIAARQAASSPKGDSGS